MGKAEGVMACKAGGASSVHVLLSCVPISDIALVPGHMGMHQLHAPLCKQTELHMHTRQSGISSPCGEVWDREDRSSVLSGHVENYDCNIGGETSCVGWGGEKCCEDKPLLFFPSSASVFSE